MHNAALVAAPVAVPLVAGQGYRLRRSASERLKKPVAWLALLALVSAAWSLPATHGRGLAFSADALGLLAVAVAALGRLWCAIYIGGRKNKTLCQDGPYSLVRNPLCLFSFIGTMGIALATHRWGLTPVAALLFIAYHRPVLRAEEARLAELFPQDYPAYCRQVPRCLPRLDGFHLGDRLTLDPREIFRALLEVIWFPLAFVAVSALTRLG